MEDAPFGFQLLLKTIENETGKLTNVIATFHYVLLSENYKCIGVGDSKDYKGDEIKSELLPDGWNKDPDCCRLRYVRKNSLYLATISPSGVDVQLDLIHASTLKVKSVIISENDLKQFNASKVMKRISSEIFEEDNKSPFDHQTVFLDPNRSSKPVRVTKDRQIPEELRPHMPIQPSFYDYGRSDIDPFHQGIPGGMIAPGNDLRMRPRFYPMNPLRPFGSNEPDPDFFMPPGGPQFH